MSENKLVNINDITTIDTSSIKSMLEKLDLLNSVVLSRAENLTKELIDNSEKISISKAELDDKLEMLDKYLTKLATIQKEVVGDRSVDKKFEGYLKKIDDIYNLKITSLNEELEATRDDIKTSSALIKKELFIETEEIKKSIFEGVDTKLKIVDKLAISQNITNFSKHASDFKNSANNLLTAVNTTNETLKEVQNLRKKGVAYFVSGVAFGAIFISIFYWSKGFLGI